MASTLLGNLHSIVNHCRPAYQPRSQWRLNTVGSVPNPFADSAKIRAVNPNDLWLEKAKEIKFKEPHDAINWLNSNKSPQETRAFATLALNLSYVNPSVSAKQERFRRYGAAFDYYNSANGKWLQKFKDIKFKDPFALIRFLEEERLNAKRLYLIKKEGPTIGNLLLSLSFDNISVRDRLEYFQFFANAHDHYRSDKGAWLKKAKDIEFADPVQLIRWLNKHRPRNESNSLTYLIECLSFGNRSIRNHMETLAVYTRSYTYLSKNPEAREELKNAYGALKADHCPEITIAKMKQYIDPNKFKSIKKGDEARIIAPKTLQYVIRTFIMFADEFAGQPS